MLAKPKKKFVYIDITCSGHQWNDRILQIGAFYPGRPLFDECVTPSLKRGMKSKLNQAGIKWKQSDRNDYSLEHSRTGEQLTVRSEDDVLRLFIDWLDAIQKAIVLVYYSERRVHIVRKFIHSMNNAGLGQSFRSLVLGFVNATPLLHSQFVKPGQLKRKSLLEYLNVKLLGEDAHIHLDTGSIRAKTLCGIFGVLSLKENSSAIGPFFMQIKLDTDVIEQYSELVSRYKSLRSKSMASLTSSLQGFFTYCGLDISFLQASYDSTEWHSAIESQLAAVSSSQRADILSILNDYFQLCSFKKK